MKLKLWRMCTYRNDGLNMVSDTAGQKEGEEYRLQNVQPVETLQVDRHFQNYLYLLDPLKKNGQHCFKATKPF